MNEYIYRVTLIYKDQVSEMHYVFYFRSMAGAVLFTQAAASSSCETGIRFSLVEIKDMTA